MALGDVSPDGFQSAPPRRERLTAQRLAFHSLHCFNPRPREGSDAGASEWTFALPVSIRAPAKGAIHPGSVTSYCITCFNPRPREGSDHPPLESTQDLASFNPRPREGSDVDHAGTGTGGPVSIRAPAKGAMWTIITDWGFGKVSIRAPAKGAITPLNTSSNCSRLFQSAPPRRERFLPSFQTGGF